MQHVLKSFTDWLLYTSVFAACCAISLCLATERLILGALPQPSELHAFIAGSTLVVYNAHFLLRRTEARKSDRYRWTLTHRYWHLIMVITGLSLIAFSLFFVSREILLTCLLLGVLSFGYTFPLLPFGQGRLRDYGWVKILTLTLVWTITTAVLPMLHWNVSVYAYPLELLIRFVFLFTLCIAFDVRDMQTDMREDILTIPNVIGINRSYSLMYFTIVVFALLCIFQYFRVGNETHLLIAAIVSILTWRAIVVSKQ